MNPTTETTTREPEDHARADALAWFASIVEMVDALREARAIDADLDSASDHEDDARRWIEESPLSVEVRGGWAPPIDYENSRENARPAEYRILLSTGGPALQLVGELNESGEPETARLEAQDWFKPWSEVRVAYMLGQAVFADTLIPAVRVDAMDDATAYLLDFARCFYFGEG